MGVLIRRATVEDAAELRDYAISLFAEGLPGIFQRPDPSLDEEVAFIRMHLDSPNSTLLVAVDDGRIVGNMGFEGGTLAEERHAGTFGLSVARGHRGRGVGTALLEALLDWAPTAGITRIQAWTWANNPGALALYERMGFEREGVARKAIIFDGAPTDAILVARLLDRQE